MVDRLGPFDESALRGPAHKQDREKAAMAITREQLDELLERSFSMSMDVLLGQPMMEIHSVVSRLPPQLAVPILEEFCLRVQQDPDRFRTDSPDSLHNLAITAKNFRRHDLEKILLKAGVDIFPDNVDLLADLLQVCYVKSNDPKLAAETWEKLERIAASIRDTQWRYWVFGALYHLRMLNNLERAKDLLVKGLEAVRGDQKCDVLRAFDDVFVDASPTPEVDKVMSAWKKGIQEGYDLSYTVALKLAVLQQRRAGSVGADRDRRHDLLQEAIEWLDVAEATFTADRRHPITEVYRVRVNVLMGLERYVEAIQYITAIYRQTEDVDHVDPSLKPQLILACQRGGQGELWKQIVNGKESVES